MIVDNAAQRESGGFTLSPAQFRAIRTTAYEHFGLDLKNGKEALVSARIGRRLRELGLTRIDDYLHLLDADTSGQELSRLIDALTTNYTSFQREPVHFDLLRREELEPRRDAPSTLHVWSAGCATGEEPYTILMHAADVLGSRGFGLVRLLASDISVRALETARSGTYPADRLAGLPESWVRRYFQQGTGDCEGLVRVKRELRQAVTFRRINLMEPFTSLPQFDVIFCRNVMIYFDKPTQERLVRAFSRQLTPGGWLLIGHSEGLMGVRHDLEYIAPATYRKPSRIE